MEHIKGALTETAGACLSLQTRHHPDWYSVSLCLKDKLNIIIIIALLKFVKNVIAVLNILIIIALYNNDCITAFIRGLDHITPENIRNYFMYGKKVANWLRTAREASRTTPGHELFASFASITSRRVHQLFASFAMGTSRCVHELLTKFCVQPTVVKYSRASQNINDHELSRASKWNFAMCS